MYDIWHAFAYDIGIKKKKMNCSAEIWLYGYGYSWIVTSMRFK